MHNYNDHHNGKGSTLGKLVAAFFAGMAVAMALGGYWFFGPKGQKRRDAAQKVIDDAEKKILDKMIALSEVSKDQYESLVDEIMDSYEDAKDLTHAHVKRLSARFKARYWEMRKLARESAEAARRETEELENE